MTRLVEYGVQSIIHLHRLMCSVHFQFSVARQMITSNLCENVQWVAPQIRLGISCSAFAFKFKTFQSLLKSRIPDSKRNIKLFYINYHIPIEGTAGPQSQENEACIFRTWFAWHSPLYSSGTHNGTTGYLFT